MHEMSLVMNLYEICRNEVDSRGSGRLDKVRISVGELSAVDCELLSFAWDVVIGEGPDRGCMLEVDWRPARQFCDSCAQEKPRAAGAWLQACPDCGGSLKITSGYELDITEITYEPADPGQDSGKGTVDERD